jgi:hypothetical protein
MKNSSDTIGNRTRDISACSTVPQPTAPPRTPGITEDSNIFINYSQSRKSLHFVFDEAHVPLITEGSSTLRI